MLRRISDRTTKAVKLLDFTDVLDGEGVAYKKLGREFVTLCPWHNDKNPSLTINPVKNFCYCFVCDIGQDPIGFIQQFHGLSFSDAVLRIAGSNNIEIVYDDYDDAEVQLQIKKIKRLKDRVEKNQLTFEKGLLTPSKESDRARKFFEDRGLTPKAITDFGLGVFNFPPTASYPNDGLRVTIPIHDHMGNLVGFSGRAIDDTIKPKYKNSRNDEIFDKSNLVFNEYRASRYIREAGFVILVEGQIDVIALHQIGIKNVVALQGAVTPGQHLIQRLSKKAKDFVLCFDGDAGGTKAVESFLKTASEKSLNGEINIRIITLSKGKDPDDYAGDGADFNLLAKNAEPWIDWRFRTWKKEVSSNDMAGLIELESKMKELVYSIKSPLLRQHYTDKAAKVLVRDGGNPSEIIKSWARPKALEASRWKPMTPLDSKFSIERRILRTYLHFPSAREKLEPAMVKIESPLLVWAWKLVQIIESTAQAEDLLEVFRTALCVVEPHYMDQLRSIAYPTIDLTEEPNHVEYLLSKMPQA